MAFEKYGVFDKELKKGLSEGKGESKEDRVKTLERKLDGAKLSFTEVNAIQEELKRLRK